MRPRSARSSARILLVSMTTPRKASYQPTASEARRSHWSTYEYVSIRTATSNFTPEPMMTLTARAYDETLGDWGSSDSECIANFSVQRMRPVICITTNSVTIAPMVIASPVKPGKKNA